MRFTPNRAACSILAAFLFSGVICSAGAAESPALLKIIPSPGLVIVDDDTLDVGGSAQREVELEAGEHVLRFFPYHTAGEWIHRYLVYPFSVGSDGRRTIDLTSCEVFTFDSSPQSAELRYRGRYLGRTPGEFLLLPGEDDSVTVLMQGYDTEVFNLDRISSLGNLDVFVSLDPQIAGMSHDDEDIMAYHYQSPARKLLAADLLLSLTSGVAMLAVGTYYNQKADDDYERYQRLLGPKAREKAYQDMKHNDRLSKASFLVGDTALGIFGYLLVRRIIFPSDDSKSPEKDIHKGLSMKVTTSRAQLSYEF